MGRLMPDLEDGVVTQPVPVTPRPALLTHFVRYSEPGGRLRRAMCGLTVDSKREHSVEPTCPTCKAELDAFENLAF